MFEKQQEGQQGQIKEKKKKHAREIRDEIRKAIMG